MKPAAMLFLGGLLAALAVALGAIGAHALKHVLSAQQLDTFHTAVHYQMLHSIGLVLIGLLILRKRDRLLELAAWAMLLGVILFSGFLYAWLATQVQAFVHVVPVGGTAFIVGWLLLAVGSLRVARSEAT